MALGPDDGLAPGTGSHAHGRPLRAAREPEGLRHGFGVQAMGKGKGTPLNMVQKWLGHAQLSTTAIYADAVGAEEQRIATKMWE